MDYFFPYRHSCNIVQKYFYIQGASGGITYNINNGVQIVGAPPPYSQATANNGVDREHSASADLPPPYRAEEEAQVTFKMIEK